MSNKPINALLIEDDPGDAFLIQQLFSETNKAEPSVVFTHADCLTAGLNRLKTGSFDVVLLDLSLPETRGVDTFDRVYSSHHDIPIVILTGLDDRETASHLVQRGAQDYLIKGEINRNLLERPIRYAIERFRMLKTLQEQRRQIEIREKYFRSLLDRLHEDVIVINRNYTITDINNSFVHTTGHDRDTIIGKTCYEMLHGLNDPCDRNEHTCALKQVFETGESTSYVDQIKNETGETVWVDVLLSPFFGDDGNVTRIILTIRDITDILKTKEALSQTEQKYFQLLNSLNEGVWVIDKDGYTEFATPRMEYLLGYNEQEMIGKPVSQFIREENVESFNDFIELRKKGIQEIRDFTFFRKDGSKMDALVEMSPLMDDHGVFKGCIAGILDNSKRRSAEKKLEQSEALYQSLVENIPVNVFRKDRDGRFTFMNSNMCKLIEKSQEEILGKTDGDFYSAELADKYRNDDLQVMRSGRIFETEERNQGSDGHEFIVNVIKTPIVNRKGKCTGIQGIFWDITEKKKLQEQLYQSQKMEAVGQLAGGVAHDFNNLLMVIRSYSEFALNQLPEKSPIRDDIQEIINAGNRASALTRQLLAFSRRQIVQPQVINLIDILLEMDKMLRRLIGEDIELITITDPDLGYIKIDPGQIEQIVMNLAVNARDAMPGGGRLIIDAHNKEILTPIQNHINTISPGNYISLSIGDNGIGISEEIQKRIFEPFFTTKERGKGTGLGLSTVFGIVKQNNSLLTLESDVGNGTTFTIYFPRVFIDRNKPTDSSQDQDSLTGTETILLVEDDASVRRLIERGLSKYGYTVLAANDGNQAIDICENYEKTIHLLVTDVVMPGMSGIELVDRIRSMRPNVQYIYMSGYTDDAILRMGILESDVLIIQKPFAQETLIQKIRSVLDAMESL